VPLKKLLGYGIGNDEEASGSTPNEDTKWVVEKSDPYQEAAVWTQRLAPMMVLQGPPGTGKSQTIVNLIADALAHKETVLVVCQKKDALTVVKKRMDGVGVGGLANLINDISADRLTTIRTLKSIADNQHNTINLEAERHAVLRQQKIDQEKHIAHRNALSARIKTLEQNLDAVNNALNETLDGTIMPYRQLKSRLNTLGFMAKSDAWKSSLLKEIHQAIETDARHKISLHNLKTHLIEIQSLSNIAATTGYPHNSFSSLTKQFSEQELSNALEQIQTVQTIATKIVNDNDSLTIQYPADTAWIAEHSFFTAATEVYGLIYTPYLYDTTVENNFDNHAKITKFVLALNYLATLSKDIVVKDIMATLRHESNQKQTTLDRIQAIATDAIHLRAINDLLEQIRSKPVFKMLNTHLLGHINQWQQHVEAIVLHYFLNKLLDKCGNSLAMLPRVEAMRSQLSTALIEKRQLDAKDIAAKFNDKTTAVNTLNNDGLLRERSAKNNPKTTLRQLYLKGADAIKATLPILLTGPENASSLLPLQKDLYDLVVIDEASQMYVAEAIPILFRAKKALIAGDINQMPPSNTFSFAEQDDDNIDIEDDYNNISITSSIDGEYRLLVAAENTLKKSSKHKVSLNVHYRSTRRELIDFSNHAFYEGKLIIPSGNAPLVTGMNTPIVFEQVAGDLLGSPKMIDGINKAEAQSIVKWLEKLWLDTTSDSRPTVGVIVNNVKQRDYVLECIEDYSTNNPIFANIYTQEQNRKTADGEDVALFVRSVETVQGDERDVIIYGFTYSGSRRSFGPLVTPRFDGRKRLNVAITRSKRGMVILNSLEMGHISNVAEKDTHERYFVWQYLRYAQAISDNSPESLETANQILNQLNPDRVTAQNTQTNTESPFEDEVKVYIESLGYHVTPQVGESGFRIDLGIKANKNSLNFLCGVECDGARWHSGWAARTRDVWRQDILESKGWTIIRVWSTTWFEHQDTAKAELQAQLAQLQL
jgi:very-short-patch-repair endonuclease